MIGRLDLFVLSSEKISHNENMIEIFINVEMLHNYFH